MMPRSWPCDDDAAIENRLHAIERGLVDQRLESAAG
jgi:hypothetical protein